MSQLWQRLLVVDVCCRLVPQEINLCLDDQKSHLRLMDAYCLRH